MIDFSDRVVVITGAAGNLGGAAAHAFEGAGATLGLIDRSPGRLERVCSELADEERHTLLGTVDMSDPDSVADGFGQILARNGRVDVLLNALGGFASGTRLQETEIKDWDFMFSLNLRTAFLACRAVIPHMLEQGRGKIVNIGARPGQRGIAGAAPYSAAKSAVIRLTESLSAEAKHQGINVNCVLPGTLDTPENREQSPGANFDRWVSPAAVANVILFLASDEANAIHGASIPVFGTG